MFRVPPRQAVAVAMALFYLLIVFSPLAPHAISSIGATRPGARECTGDCNLCGCSTESRAANTCCCSKKRQQAHIHEENEETDADCCKKDSAERRTVIACGCPCGSEKQDSLLFNGTSEVLPYSFSERHNISHTNTAYFSFLHDMTSRHVEPPDPPPKLI